MLSRISELPLLGATGEKLKHPEQHPGTGVLGGQSFKSWSEQHWFLPWSFRERVRAPQRPIQNWHSGGEHQKIQDLQQCLEKSSLLPQPIPVPVPLMGMTRVWPFHPWTLQQHTPKSQAPILHTRLGSVVKVTLPVKWPFINPFCQPRYLSQLAGSSHQEGVCKQKTASPLQAVNI